MMVSNEIIELQDKQLGWPTGDLIGRGDLANATGALLASSSLRWSGAQSSATK